MISRGYRYFVFAFCLAFQQSNDSSEHGSNFQFVEGYHLSPVATSTTRRRSTTPLYSTIETESITDLLTIRHEQIDDVLISQSIAQRIREARTNRSLSQVLVVESEYTNYVDEKDQLLKIRKQQQNLEKTQVLQRRQQQQQQEQQKADTKREEEEKAKRMLLKKRPVNGLQIPYATTIKALRTYHALKGDLALPRKFIVPETSEYPEECHGIDLSATVYNMKWWSKHVKAHTDRVAELNEIGFVWDRLQTEWNLVLEALGTYKMLYDNVMVPKSFVVPHGSNVWPTATWDLKLGRAVSRIRMRNDYLRDGKTSLARREQLDGLGFVWNVNEHLFRKFYLSLKHYAKLEQREQGTKNRQDNIRALRVPSTYVIPQHDDWPKEFWGYKLGEKCQAVRQKGLYVKSSTKRQQVLQELGFHYKKGNASLGWLETVHAAAIYSKMNNRKLDVPYNFVVPKPDDNNCYAGENDWPWPEQLWGLPLGQRLKDIRVKGSYLTGDSADIRRSQLDALGFNWTPKRGRKPKTVRQTLKEMCNVIDKHMTPTD